MCQIYFVTKKGKSNVDKLSKEEPFTKITN